MHAFELAAVSVRTLVIAIGKNIFLLKFFFMLPFSLILFVSAINILAILKTFAPGQSQHNSLFC